ncbi:hypothetical protein AAHA92_28841 [Salvia divinorum]|uniref:Uncharacterized protein n=1 Tax=Salvia divinorum TaxID=28513 RepID=A0ABD1FWV2_SALDI
MYLPSLNPLFGDGEKGSCHSHFWQAVEYLLAISCFGSQTLGRLDFSGLRELMGRADVAVGPRIGLEKRTRTSISVALNSASISVL